MKILNLSPVALCLLSVTLTLTSPITARAQHEAGDTHGPSKYLFISNVDLKPNQAGPYAKAQGVEVQALRATKAPGHYIGMWAITGADHVLYLEGFDSFGDLQKEHEAIYGIPSAVAAITAGDAGQAASTAKDVNSIYSFEKELSFNTNLDLSKMRFMRIILFHVRQGRDDDFRNLAKLYVKAYQTAIPDAHWAIFQKMYGIGSDNTYILVTPMESLALVDAIHGGNDKFVSAVGKEQLQALEKGMNEAVESSETNLFAFDPQLSYVPDSWLTSDFWGKK
jgi:hypothetical protein